MRGKGRAKRNQQGEEDDHTTKAVGMSYGDT